MNNQSTRVLVMEQSFISSFVFFNIISMSKEGYYFLLFVLIAIATSLERKML